MKSLAPILLAAALSTPAAAVDVTVIGLFSGRAVITVDRGNPRTLRIGESTPEGVKLVAADSSSATVEIEGKRLTLEMGRHFESASQTGTRREVTLPADSHGHFVTSGSVNGAHIRFLIDTGATLVSIPAAQATRLGIDYRKGRRGISQTANGAVSFWRVNLDSVSVGGVTLTNVEGAVHESGGLDTALLGMSFLNRTEMRREGTYLTLTKRY
ncbi:MAG: TIGR02281 family clan AA aspartic protease [Usitatibacter sp.]